MPVVELNVKRLYSLIGQQVDVNLLADSISNLGADVEGINGDVLSVEFFPDRPDLLSVEGVARALRAYMEIEPDLKRYEVRDSSVEMRVEKSILPIRGYIQCLDVKGVSLDEEILKDLMDLQEDLHWALGRGRKKVAIGVHDSSQITPPYRYLASAPGDRAFEPLGFPGSEMNLGEILERHPKGLEYAHIISGFDRYPLILDSKHEVLSMPPIINGELTKLTVETTQMFVEMTGTDERAVEKAMNILASAFAENGWKLFHVNVRYPEDLVKTPDLEPESRKLSIPYTNKMLGLNLTAGEMENCLRRTGYGAKKEGGDSLEVKIPAYRADILHDIDIVEDVAIGYGFSNFKPELPPISTTGRRLPIDSVSEKARNAMLGLGFTEVSTLMLTNEENNFSKMGFEGDAVKVKNPISEEHTIIRTHLLPGLLEVLHINRHRELPQHIYEVGEVLLPDPEAETGAKKETHLAACLIHNKANFSEGKSIFNALLRDMDFKHENLGPTHRPGFIPGRCAGVDATAYFGELHPSVLTNFELEFPVVAMEITLK